MLCCMLSYQWLGKLTLIKAIATSVGIKQPVYLRSSIYTYTIRKTNHRITQEHFDQQFSQAVLCSHQP